MLLFRFALNSIVNSTSYPPGHLPTISLLKRKGFRFSSMVHYAVQRATAGAHPSIDRYAAHFVRGISRRRGQMVCYRTVCDDGGVVATSASHTIVNRRIANRKSNSQHSTHPQSQITPRIIFAYMPIRVTALEMERRGEIPNYVYSDEHAEATICV